MPISDRSQVINTINQTQRKLREEMKDIVKQKATHSRYVAMSRSEKRVTEFHHDRLTQEQSLQKDCKKAERMARRIGQVLERLRKEFNKVKNHLGNYNFANTVGIDSTCGGDCSDDMSTDIGTRQAWKRELENMLTMVWHYIDAQHLGDYALGHQPVVASDPTCSSSASVTNCCPKVYRPFFHYYTPDGDCLSLATEPGSHSGDSSAVTPAGNYNDVETRGCILGYKALDPVNPTAENKSAPGTHKHFQITNKDHEIRQLWKLLVGSSGGVAVDRSAWWSFLVANAVDAGAADAAALKSHFDNNICLPDEMTATLALGNAASDGTHDSIYFILQDIAAGTTNTSATTGGVGDAAITKTNPPKESSAYAPGGETVANGSGAFDEALKHAPTICNVEDESDLQFIFKLITCVMNSVRKCQINNDREQQVIEYVNEVSECNEAFHQDVFSDLTSIDETELDQRYLIGKEMSADLDALKKENCCTKQNFFNDVTLSGNSW
jgi:hypothetical protein